VAGDADIAVHSMKDVPADLPEGFAIPAILDRHSPEDAFVSAQHDSVAALPQGAHVGTSSLRRQAQLLFHRPDLRISPLRGNVNTRLAKLDAGDYDAIILARAGLERLAMDDRVRSVIDPEFSLPAVAQGAIGIECLAGSPAAELVASLDDHATRACVEAERALSSGLGGSCSVPLGGYCVADGDGLWLRAVVGAPDGSRLLRTEARGAVADRVRIGERAANDLLGQGADEIISSLKTG
ncbi:MAG: hydroxymethylbilane synthase, partial [Pseudomonadota bacterium]